MLNNTKLIAIGRSRYLFDSIKYLSSKGYIFKAIVTDEAYEEYNIKHTDFEKLAQEISATFFKIKNLENKELINIIKNNMISLAISANWKYTISKKILDFFEHGILNFHLGNLPDYKGNATVNWTIINGESNIFGNIHKMDNKLDAGDVITRKNIPITPEVYIEDILRQAEADAPLLFEDAIMRVLKNKNTFEVKGTAHGLRCYPRLPEDSQINWNQPVENISRLVRASSHPYNGAYSFLDGKKVVIWKARPIISEDKFLAVPGHVVSFDKVKGSILVACIDGLLEVQNIETNGEIMLPTDLVKSIRVRFK